MTPAKREAINALYDLKKAFLRVSASWVDEMDQGYPFVTEFDQLTDEVIEWTDTVTNNIHNNPENHK